MISDAQLILKLKAMLLTLESLLSPQRTVENLLSKSQRSEELVALENLLSKPQRSESETRMANRLTHRLMRKYVLKLAKSWTYSDADALDVAAEFWNIFWKHRLINQYSRNCSSFVKWFDEGVTNWLVNEASV